MQFIEVMKYTVQRVNLNTTKGLAEHPLLDLVVPVSEN